MSVQRLSDSQILTSINSQQAAEAVWHAFSNFGLGNVVIDPNQSKVTGSTGMSLSSYGKTFTAFFESRPDGLLISLRGDEQVAGTIDFGRGKKQVAELGSMVVWQLEQALEKPSEYSRAVEMTPTPTPVAPIASPYNAPQVSYGQPTMPGMPIYGVATIPKRGTAVLIYGILGLFCCFNIPAILALIYGAKALAEYKDHDPGDKVMVYIGMALGVIGVCLLLFGPLIRSLMR